MAGALCRGQEGSRRQSQWSTWRECGLKWPREEGTRQMGQGSNLWAECPDWRVGCFGAIQSAFGTAKGMRLGTSGVRGEVRAGGGVWGVTSISVIAAPREVDQAEGVLGNRASCLQRVGEGPVRSVWPSPFLRSLRTLRPREIQSLSQGRAATEGVS